MSRYLIAATLAFLGGWSGSAEACAFCGGFFSGYGPYSTGYRGTAGFGGNYYGAGYGYGPATYTAGYALLSCWICSGHGRARRMQRRAVRRSYFANLFGFGPAYGAPPAYAPAGPQTFSAGYAPYSGGYAASYGSPSYGLSSGCGSCNSCGSCGTPTVVNSPPGDCPCSGGGAQYTPYDSGAGVYSAPSSCPNGNCGAGYTPSTESLRPVPMDSSAGETYPGDVNTLPGETIVPGSFRDTPSGYESAPTYSSPTYSSPTYSSPTYSSPTYSNPTYGSEYPIDPNGPPQLPPGASNPSPWMTRPDSVNSPGDRPSTGRSETEDGAFGPRSTPPRRETPRDNVRPRDDEMFPRGGGGNSGGSGGRTFEPPAREPFGGVRDLEDLGPDDGSTDAFKPVQPRGSRDGAAGVTPRSLDHLSDRPVDSGVVVARTRTLARARHSLPRRVARRYDLEQGRYAAPGRRVASKR